LSEAAEVVAEHPNLRIALNHTGYPMDRSPIALEIWRKGMEALAANENIWCKISGLPVLGEPYTVASNKPIILDAIRIFGVDRCMFASNFPVDGLKGSWDHLYTTYKRSVADFSQEDREKLFAKNALAFYRIEV
jgi:predicted TIM-barrel fold metal-dependent hydrolase